MSCKICGLKPARCNVTRVLGASAGLIPSRSVSTMPVNISCMAATSRRRLASSLCCAAPSASGGLSGSRRGALPIIWLVNNVPKPAALACCGSVAVLAVSVVASMTILPCCFLVETIIASGPSWSQISSIAVAVSTAVTVTFGIGHPPLG